MLPGQLRWLLHQPPSLSGVLDEAGNPLGRGSCHGSETDTVTLSNLRLEVIDGSGWHRTETGGISLPAIPGLQKLNEV